MFKVQHNELDERDPQGGVLDITMIVTKATLQQIQLVFDCDSI